MAHRNAPRTPTGRLRLARCVVEDGWPLRRAAERFQVAPTTAKRRTDRYRQHGAAGISDHPSRPHHSPRRLPPRTERRTLGLRVRERLGPARIPARLGLNPATVHRVLVRCPGSLSGAPPGRPGPCHRRDGAPLRATSAPDPASWSTWTPRSWAVSPTWRPQGARPARRPQASQRGRLRLPAHRDR
jgi:transposase-like protein